MRLVETTVTINDQRKRAMARRVVEAMGPDGVRGRRVALFGLTFKPNTDDMREAPSLSIIRALQDQGALIHATDPAGIDQARKVLDDVTFHADPYDAASEAEAIVLVTEWEAYRSLDFARLKAAMKRPLLVDLRNVYDGVHAARHGFSYVAIGRPDETRD